MSIVQTASYEIPSFYVGVIEANIDMSAQTTEIPTYQYTAVDVVAASGAGLTGPAGLAGPAAAGASCIGILQNNPKLAEAGQVMVHGVSKAQAGGTFAVGTILMTNSTGQLIAATTGNFGIAKALEAGVAGVVVSVLLFGYGKQ
jgi:hypothetical protein